MNHLEKLSGFAAVARSGSFHKAARERRVSQPGLSRSIEILEKILGYQLLMRSVKGVKLTDKGKLVLSFFESLEANSQDLHAKLTTETSVVAGHIQVATYESLCTYFWPEFLKYFIAKHPHLKISLSTIHPTAHLNKLIAGGIDVVVDSEPEISPQYNTYVLYTDRFNFYKSPNLDLNIKANEFIFVNQAYDEDKLSLRDHLIKRNITTYKSYSLDTFTSVKAFTLSSLGLGIMPERLVQLELKRGLLEHVEVKGFARQGFGRHRICFSTQLDPKNDMRIKILKQELNYFIKNEN